MKPSKKERAILSPVVGALLVVATSQAAAHCGRLDTALLKTPIDFGKPPAPPSSPSLTESSKAQEGGDMKGTMAHKSLEGGTGRDAGMAHPVPAKPKTPPVPRFEVRAGETLNAVLSRWSQDAHWTLAWEPPSDFTIASGAAFYGRFEDVVQTLLDSLRQAGATYGGELWAHNKTLRIINVR